MTKIKRAIQLKSANLTASQIDEVFELMAEVFHENFSNGVKTTIPGLAIFTPKNRAAYKTKALGREILVKEKKVMRVRISDSFYKNENKKHD